MDEFIDVEDAQHVNLFKNLLRAVYWFDDSLQSHMEAAGWPRTSRTKSFVLTNVANGITRPIQIAENLGLSRQAIHVALTDLEKEGLVTMLPDPNDKRAKVVAFPSDRVGDQIRRSAIQGLRHIEQELEKRLGPELFAQVCEGLQADWQAPITPKNTNQEEESNDKS